MKPEGEGMRRTVYEYDCVLRYLEKIKYKQTYAEISRYTSIIRINSDMLQDIINEIRQFNPDVYIPGTAERVGTMLAETSMKLEDLQIDLNKKLI